jgi:hypothetical protein
VKLVSMIGVGCGLAVAALASTSAAAASSSHPAAVGCKPEAGKRIVDGRDYRFTLLVGKVEDMYMPRQVRANHLKQGEVMLGGTMTPVAMLMGGPIRHVEVQICERASRAVVASATPKIVVEDTTKGRAVTLPFSVMEGIGAGVADLHYGNNLAIPAGHRFLVTVTWKRERAIFRYVSPRARHPGH